MHQEDRVAIAGGDQLLEVASLNAFHDDRVGPAGIRRTPARRCRPGRGPARGNRPRYRGLSVGRRFVALDGDLAVQVGLGGTVGQIGQRDIEVALFGLHAYLGGR